MQISLLYKEDFIAGGSLIFLDKSKKTIHLRYLALNRDTPSRYNVPYYIIWDAIKKASDLGFKKICFGSTVNDPEHPAYKLKKNFGAEYEKIYSILTPPSKLFKIGYKFYTSIWSR